MDNVNRQRILELATTAPNVDNAQPFYFRWQGDRLLVFRDEARDRQRGNAGNYVSMVGLGCLVECITIAASGEGLSADVDFRYEPHHLDAPWVVISFDPDPAEPDELMFRTGKSSPLPDEMKTLRLPLSSVVSTPNPVKSQSVVG